MIQVIGQNQIMMKALHVQSISEVTILPKDVKIYKVFGV